MKKIYCILLSLCFLFSLPIFANSLVFAEPVVETQATITAENKTVNRGMPFDVPINISNNLGLTSLMLTVTYNNTDDNIKLVGADKGEEMSGFAFTPSGTVLKAGNTSTFNLVFYANEPVSTNGVLATLHFVSAITAPLGDYDINISFDPDNTRKNTGVPATVSVQSPVITLTNGKFLVEWQDWNGTLLKTQEYNAQPGEILVPPANPTREEDGCYSYEFAKWSNPTKEGENKIVYTAEYTLTPQKHWVYYYIDGYEDGFYKALECTYGETPELKDYPVIQNYNFVGWFTDSNFTTKFTGTMPGEDLNLYGYLKYNIREDVYPKIQLKHVSTDEHNIAKITVNVLENPGFNSLKLTLTEDCFNNEYFTLVDFKNNTETFDNMSFTHSGGAIGTFPYSFMWENTTENTTATGEILTLYFQINNDTPKGSYPITLTYDKKSDVTYFKDATTMWYSMLDIVDTKIPVGTKTDFEAQVAGTSIILKAKSNKEIAYNVEMVIEDVTSKMIDQLGADKINKAIGDNRKVSKIYSIYFTQNGELFEPNATMTYTLQLTEEQKLAVDLTLFKVNNDQISNYNSALQNNNINFTSDVIAEWLIAEDIASIGAGFAGSISVQAMLMIVMLCSDVLAGALIVLAKNFKSKKHKIQGGIE